MENIHRQHTIIGMAGHIDHGKTALIKALTGIETDRLREEQLRGITIDIGFAYWKDDVTIIDVPGHERFVKNMVAGVSTVDMFLLVVAADDGIMPQTIEHLEILKFFGVQQGVVALNKTDLVEDEWLEMIEEDIRKVLKRYDYGNLPLVRVSAITASGIENLRATLESVIAQKQRTFLDRPFRLNIDRNFSAKGFGTVITGTVLSSNVCLGDRLELLPSGLTVKVRGIQVHQHGTEEAVAGQRAAINLSGAEPAELYRGAVLTEPGSLETSTELLAEIRPVFNISFKIRRYMELRVHIGTDEVHGKMDWLEDGPFRPERECHYIRLKLERPAVAAPGDAILLRSISPVTTLAGGKILQINPPKLKRRPEIWEPYMNGLKNDDLQARLIVILSHSGYSTLTLKDLKRRLFIKEEALLSAVKKLVNRQQISEFEFRNEQHYMSTAVLEQGMTLIVQKLEEEFARDAYKTGFNFGELKNLFAGHKFGDAFLSRAVQLAKNKELIASDGERYHSKRRNELEAVRLLKARLVDYYRTARFSVDSIEQLSEQLNTGLKSLRNLLQECVKDGELLSVDGQFYLHQDVFRELLVFLSGYFRDHQELPIAEVKSFTGSTRKFIMPIMEFLDSKKYTIRQGDLRIKGPELS